MYVNDYVHMQDTLYTIDMILLYVDLWKDRLMISK